MNKQYLIISSIQHVILRKLFYATCALHCFKFKNIFDFTDVKEQQLDFWSSETPTYINYLLTLGTDTQMYNEYICFSNQRLTSKTKDLIIFLVSYLCLQF